MLGLKGGSSPIVVCPGTRYLYWINLDCDGLAAAFIAGGTGAGICQSHTHMSPLTGFDFYLSFSTQC